MQEGDEPDEVGRLLRPGDRPVQAVQLVPFGGHVLGGLALGETGGDRVDGDAVVAEFACHGPGQGDDRALGGDVVGEARRAVQGGVRGDG